jgi:hypothetical protein
VVLPATKEKLNTQLISKASSKTTTGKNQKSKDYEEEVK